MRNYTKVAVLLASLPVFVSLAGCPALAVARVAKKASESSSSSDKDKAAKPEAENSATPTKQPEASVTP